MTEETAFVIKGVLAFVALVILLIHMATTGGEMSLARALRYVALLVATAAVAYASQEQVHQDAEWEPRQWGGIAIILTVLAAAIASILEDRGITLQRRRDTTHDR